MCQGSGGYEHRGKGGEVEHGTSLSSLLWAIMIYRSFDLRDGL